MARLIYPRAKGGTPSGGGAVPVPNLRTLSWSGALQVILCSLPSSRRHRVPQGPLQSPCLLTAALTQARGIGVVPCSLAEAPFALADPPGARHASLRGDCRHRALPQAPATLRNLV